MLPGVAPGAILRSIVYVSRNAKTPHLRGFREIAGERVGLNGVRPVPIEWVADFAPQAGLRRSK
jgi:hypothetical protein